MHERQKQIDLRKETYKCSSKRNGEETKETEKSDERTQM